METDQGEKVESSNPNESAIINQLEKSERSAWFRFFLSIGFATVAIGLGVFFSSIENIDKVPKSIFSMALLALGFVIMFLAGFSYYPEGFRKRIGISGIIVLLAGVIATLAGTEFNIATSYLLPLGIIIGTIGFLMTVASIMKFKK